MELLLNGGVCHSEAESMSAWSYLTFNRYLNERLVEVLDYLIIHIWNCKKWRIHTCFDFLLKIKNIQLLCKLLNGINPHNIKKSLDIRLRSPGDISISGVSSCSLRWPACWWKFSAARSFNVVPPGMMQPMVWIFFPRWKSHQIRRLHGLLKAVSWK